LSHCKNEVHLEQTVGTFTAQLNYSTQNSTIEREDKALFPVLEQLKPNFAKGLAIK
jgi:hypothetical protein